MAPVTQRGQSQTEAAEQGQQRQQQTGQACALQPVQQRLPLTITTGEQQGAVLDALGQVNLLGTDQAIGFGVLEWAGMFLAQANGLAEPEALEGRGGGGVCHAASRCPVQLSG